jgi:hypothetical protein
MSDVSATEINRYLQDREVVRTHVYCVIDEVHEYDGGSEDRVTTACGHYLYAHRYDERTAWADTEITVTGICHHCTAELRDRLSDGETIEVSAEAARVAARELQRTIDRTGGPDVGAREACTPLAELREEVDGNNDLDAYAEGYIVSAIDKIARERGIDVSGADPLTDAIFQAQQELADVAGVCDE